MIITPKQPRDDKTISRLSDGSEVQFPPYVKAGAPQSLRQSRDASYRETGGYDEADGLRGLRLY